MPERGYDFLTWKSFPSSAKAVNDTDVWFNWGYPATGLAVKSGSKLRITLNVKQEGIPPPWKSHLSMRKTGEWAKVIAAIYAPNGTFDWKPLETTATVPSDVVMVDILLTGAPKGTNWFDDLKIYQDDVLIYSDDFSKWDPVIGAGVGAPIGGAVGYFLKEPLGPMVSEVVGAVLGGALGGGIGLLTGLGIIPVPQIPALGATLEEPEAPTQLGKYQITG